MSRKGNRSDGGGQQSLTITLGEPTDPVKRPDGKYEVSLTAWYRGPKQRLGQPAEVLLFDNNAHLTTEPVGDEGRVAFFFDDLEAGSSHLFVVKVGGEGGPTSSPRRVRIPEEKVRAKKLVPNTVTKGDEHFVDLQVLDYDGKGIKDAVVRLYDPAATGGKVDLTTDKNGVTSTTLRFGGRKQTYAATVLGTEVNCEFTLYRH